MAVQTRPFFSTVTGRILGSIAVLAGLFALMYFTSPKQDPKKIAVVEEKKLDATDVRSDKELARIMEGLRPGRLGISSDREEMVSQLNNWSDKFIDEDEVAALVSDEGLLTKLLSGDGLKRATTDVYLPEDASHVRESLLARTIVENITKDLKTDTARAVGLFAFVSSYISVLPDAASDSMAVTPYESMLFGVGTAADRAWVFGTLLRQLRLDAVVLRPQDNTVANKWLIGVPVPKSGVLLFDPLLGLPVPSIEDDAKTPFPEQPATLTQVRAEDAIFRQLDGPDDPYPLEAKHFKEVSVELIGSSSAWASRMAELQFMLPVDVNVDLYDGLGKNAIYQPGKLQRVIEAGEGLWTEEQISIWSYPEQQIAKIEAAHGVEGTELGNLMYVMKGPYLNEVDQSTGNVFQTTAKRSLHFVRIQQLQGDCVEALKNLFPIRNAAAQLQVPANIIANDYATIWSGMCQFEQQRYQPALNTFQRYVNSHNQGEGFSRVAFEWAAMCYTKVPDNPEAYLKAAELLANAPRGFSAQRDTFLVRRWLKMSGVDVNQPPKTTEQPLPREPSSNPKANDNTEQSDPKLPPSPKLPETLES